MSIDRRSFIKLTAVSGGAAALAACSTGSPENQLIRFVPDEDLTPGIAEIKNGVCPICRAGCGTTVRVMQGDAQVVRNGQTGVMTMSLAKKLDGNPSHPISQGGICPRGQASIQITYHPDRLIEPLKRRGNRGSGDYQPVTWDIAVAELVSKLDAGGAAVAALTRPGSTSRNDLIALFLEKSGAPAPVTYELFSDDVLRQANLRSFGHEQLPTFDFGNSRLVISFGADFLGTWNSPVSQMAGYGKMRGGRPGIRGRLVQVEPRMSLTGASADEWVAIRPGTEGILALGLANAVGAKNASQYTPAEVEKQTGIKADRVERLASMLKDIRPAVAVVAGAPLAQTNGLFTAMAVNTLNEALGAVDAPGGLSFTPQTGAGSARLQADKARSLRQFAADILAGKNVPQVLIVDGANPVHTAPPAWKVKDALAKIPYIVSFGSFADDTSVMADLILPDHSALESWRDSRPESGTTKAIVTVAGPAMSPLHNTRATEDVLLDVAKKLKKPLGGMPDSLSAMLQAAAGGDDAWATAKKQGWVELKDGKGSAPKAQGSSAPKASPQPSPLSPGFDGDPSQYPFHFLPFASQAFLDGSTAHLPWLQEMPDPLSSAMWSTWVEINPTTANRLGIAMGDMIAITSAHGTVHAPAVLSPGTAPDIVAMPAGQGHETFTRYASGRGSNPVNVLAPVVEPETGALAWAATRVKIARVSEGNGELVLYGGALKEFEAHR
ncbi:MAG TPA: molybdopterin-dependent oxidoreductase [Vicinamibacterales bacterium]|nr:molybdopterin-dependent oxidoreductase [Vicinamibacterales bacterium]